MQIRLPGRPRTWLLTAVAAAIAAVPSAAGAGVHAAPRTASTAVVTPPANAKADYQLGGAYPPPNGVRVVARDRTAAPAPGLYNICYVNGYQTQPDEIGWWKANHDELLLRDGNGQYVVDEQWGELLLDVRTEAKRQALAAIVGGWIAGCATAGFQGVEIDNLDTFDRSGGLVTREQGLAFARLLTAAAHANGLAIGQKNAAEVAPDGRSFGFDFAVAEECGRYDECGSYVDGYGANVIVVEYRRTDFRKTCRDFGPRLSIILRDLPLAPAGSPGYVYDAC